MSAADLHKMRLVKLGEELMRASLDDNHWKFTIVFMKPHQPIQSTGLVNVPKPHRPCGLGRLLLCIIYDAVIVLAILMIAGAFALHLPFSHQSAGRDFAYTLYLLSAWFLYLAWCWRNGGMTLGMRAWKVQLISDRGGHPAWWQCGLRFGAAWLSATAAGMGYWWKLLDRQKLSWHDRLSQTRLIYLAER